MHAISTDTATALELEDVSVHRWSAVRQEQQLLLDRVSWRARAGEHWVVLGPNGAGKTTLLNLAAAVSHPSSGTVAVLGARLGTVDMRALRERIGLVDARTARALRGSSTMLAIVMTGAFGSIALQQRRLRGEHEARALSLLDSVGAVQLAERRFEDCSQGERQRALLARALMNDPELLLLDEPMSGLDLPARERLIQALSRLAVEHPELPTVMVTHHLEEIPPTSTHALLLRAGRILAQGPVEEVITGARVSACFDVPVEVSRRSGRWSAAVRLSA